MKKKIISALLCASMVASMAAGCGSSDTADTTTTDNTATTPATEAAPAADTATEAATDATASDEGKVLNIYCWNEEFKSRLEDHYPGYTIVDGTTGTIGDVTVKWNITPNDDNAYQNNLDATLLKQADAAADDKIDLFLVEADYALKYVDTDYTMDVADLGITDADIADQYQYTKDIVTDSNGKLKGLTWQGCPGVLFYNREAAKEVLGSDDPADVQEYVKDWDTFNETAKTLKAAGYKITSSTNDSYRVYSNNVTSKWVVDGKINIDDNIMKWVDQTKKYTDKGYNNKSSLWDSTWAADQGPSGKVFGFFYSTWGINFTLLGNSLATPVKEGGKEEVGNGIYGDYAVCEGPQSYYWGGTWICAAAGTDNANLVKDVMKTLCCDKATMKKITEDTQDYTNTTSGMNEIASSNFKSDFLGGQNHIKLFAKSAPKISMKNISSYDQGLNEEFQKAMKDYFDGNVTKDKALDNFYKAAIEKYPNLSK